MAQDLASPSVLQSYLTLNNVLIAGVVWLVTYAAFRCRRPRGIPPGPPALPIVGSLPFIDYKNFNKDCIRLAQEYGEVFSVYFGSTLLIVLNNYDVIREAFVTKGVAFAGRPGKKNDPRVAAANPYHPIHGIIHSSYSPEWKRQRSNAVSILRFLGWGKFAVEQHIREECNILVNNFKLQKGEAFAPNRLIGISISNIICGLLFGNRYEHDDAEFLELLQLVDNYFANRYANADSVFIPLLRFRKSYRDGVNHLKAFNQGMREFSDRRIEEGRQRLAGGQEPKDFVTLYLQDLEKSAEGDSNVRISEDWLGPIIRDFFNAGAETSTTTLTWVLLYMAAHQEVQQKIQEEIDTKFGKGEHQFSITDKAKMPYLEAALLETQRLSSIAPFCIPHATTTDVELKGHLIPKDSIVVANLYSCSVDSRTWEDPHTFRPDRFIDENGEVNKPEFWIPYSMGRRMCLGEQLARQELILFFAFMMNSFHIRFDPDQPAPSLEADYRGVRRPKPFKIVATPRF